MEYIDILVIGNIDEKFIKNLKDFVSSKFKIPGRILPPITLPEEAFDFNRQQYLADILLKKIESYLKPDDIRILGVINEDIYTPGLNFVFGQAIGFGRSALIALKRLDPRFWQQKSNSRLLFKRARKEAIHELGHTFGLGHCQNIKCVMYFSNGLADTDNKPDHFCIDCQKKLKQYEQ